MHKKITLRYLLSPVVLVVLDSYVAQSLANCCCWFVSSQNPFSWCYDGFRDLAELFLQSWVWVVEVGSHFVGSARHNNQEWARLKRKIINSVAGLVSLTVVASCNSAIVLQFLTLSGSEPWSGKKKFWKLYQLIFAENKNGKKKN